MNIYLTVVLGTNLTGPTNVDVAVEQYLAVHDSGAAALGAAMIDFATKYPKYSILQPKIPGELSLDQLEGMVHKCRVSQRGSEVDHDAGD